MADQEYICIKEFAERAGVSPQAIYKRLNQVNNQLINYIKPVGNQRMLNIKALQDIYGIEVVNQNQPVEQPVVNFSQPMQDQIRMLQDQLNIKDQQLREQAERDQKKDEQIRKLHEDLIEQDQRHHEQIRKHCKRFGGSLSNEETWKLAGISKMTFYKYLKELQQDQ